MASPPNPPDGPQEVEATSSGSCASFRDVVSQVRAFETRVMARLDEMETATANQRRHELCMLESRVSTNLEQHVAILMTKLDVCIQKVETCSSYQIAKISDLASKFSEEGRLMTKLELCNQKIEACGQRAEICGQKVETCSSDQIATISDIASKFSEIVCEAGKASQAGAGALQAKVEAGFCQLGAQANTMLEKADALTEQIRACTDLLAQKTEDLLAWQTKQVPGYKTQMLILRQGDGASITTGSKVTMHATGVLMQTGKKFWSTRDPGSNTWSFKAGAGALLKGVDLGILGMKVGEERMLLVPPEEGCGAAGNAKFNIPAGATLQYTLECLSVE